MSVASNGDPHATLPTHMTNIQALEIRGDERPPSLRRSSMATFATIKEEPEDLELEPPKIPFISSYSQFPSIAAQQASRTVFRFSMVQ